MLFTVIVSEQTPQITPAFAKEVQGTVGDAQRLIHEGITGLREVEQRLEEAEHSVRYLSALAGQLQFPPSRPPELYNSGIASVLQYALPSHVPSPPPLPMPELARPSTSSSYSATSSTLDY